MRQTASKRGRFHSVFTQKLTKTHSIWPWHTEIWVLGTEKGNFMSLNTEEWMWFVFYRNHEKFLSSTFYWASKRWLCEQNNTVPCHIPYPLICLTQEEAFTLHGLLISPRPREKTKKWRIFKKNTHLKKVSTPSYFLYTFYLYLLIFWKVNTECQHSFIEKY